MKETLLSTTPSIFISALCFFGATFGVSVYSKIDMIGAICTLLSRGAIISMLVVIFILPTLLLLFDKLIMKTTKGMKGV
jgi:predicted RND superfamily exporter protein